MDSKLLPALALMVAVLIWGLVPSMIRSFALETGPADSVVIRMWANALFSLPLLHGLTDWHIERKDWPRLLLLSCVCNFGYYVGAIYGFANLSAGAGGMLYATNPLMIVGLAIAIGQERLSPAVALGMTISFLGTLYLFSGGLDGAGGNPVFGGLMMLAACFAWAVYAVFVRPLVRKYGPLKITFWSIILPALPSLIFYNANTLHTLENLSRDAIAAMLIMALAGTILSVNLWNFATLHLPPSSTGISLYLIPPATALFGWFWLHEKVGTQTIIGGAVIMFGVAVAEFGKSFFSAKVQSA